MSELNSKIIKATKWSSVTEIIAKLITPISTMVLARLLTPDAFGVLVTVTMVVSFAEIFTDAGFQKYLIQKNFASEKEEYQSITVAFWSNLVTSLFIWFIIIIFSDNLATLVGNTGYGAVISISCICIPLEAFSSIQMAIFRRKFDFKSLFYVRLIGILIPLIITIPLAILTRSYWALVIGMIALNLSNAIFLTIKSLWKPNFFYNWKLLKQMLSFSIWSMLEAVSIWLTGYIDIFIVSVVLNEYYLGIYRTSMTTVGQIVSIITAATTPVLFSTLSRLQNNPQEFKQMFFKFQKIVGMLVIPLGVGIYIYRDFVTLVLLGNQWTEAANFIGMWALTSAMTIVLAHYCSEVYRAIGKPKLSVLVQVLHISFLLPSILIAVKYDFETLCTVRAIVRLQLIVVNLIIMYALVHFSPLSMIKNIYHSLVAVCIMIITSFVLTYLFTGYLWTIVSIIICGFSYLMGLCLFSSDRRILLSIKNKNKIL